MDFAETEDQKMIRAMVREFAEDVAGPTCNKRDKEQIAPIEEFKKFANNSHWRVDYKPSSKPTHSG